MEGAYVAARLRIYNLQNARTRQLVKDWIFQGSPFFLLAIDKRKSQLRITMTSSYQRASYPNSL